MPAQEIVALRKQAHRRGALQDDNEVFNIVLTGGPCGGKSSSMADMREKFEALGYSVYTVPEMATTVFNSMGVTGAGGPTLPCCLVHASRRVLVRAHCRVRPLRL